MRSSLRHTCAITILSIILLSVNLVLTMPSAAMTLKSTFLRSSLNPEPKMTSSRSSSIMFIQNRGQWDQRAAFQIWGSPTDTMWIAKDGSIWLTLIEHPRRSPAQSHFPFDREPSLFNRFSDRQPVRGANLKLTFVGANPTPRLEPFDRLDTVVSYFGGADESKWYPNTPVWGGVRVVDLYPGIDLELRGSGGSLAFRVVCKVNCTLALEEFRLQIEGTDRVEKTTEVGRLRLGTAVGMVTLPLMELVTLDGTTTGTIHPEVRHNGQTVVITAPFLSSASSWSARPVTDPADSPGLLYATYLGGSDYDELRDIDTDALGSLYVSGLTCSSDFPTTPSAFDTTFAGPSSSPGCDAYVAKFDPTGSTLVYATFLGGAGRDWINAIHVDDSGAAYLVGETSSADFPVTPGAFDTSYNGGLVDGFLTKLSPDGTKLMYSTYLGGAADETATSIAVGASGTSYVAGATWSPDFPVTQSAFDQTQNGLIDVFLVELAPDGSEILYGTFIGGSKQDFVHHDGIAIDNAGLVYLAGFTASADFPTTKAAFDSTHNGDLDGFVLKLDIASSTLIYATFVGGNSTDGVVDMVLAPDGSGLVYIVGATGSTNFPVTSEAFDNSYKGGLRDGFVSVIDQTGSTLIFSTFLGGSEYDAIRGIDVTDMGVLIAGETASPDFPIVEDAFDATYNGGVDAFVARISIHDGKLNYSTFLGGSSDDWGRDIVIVAGSSRVYVAGFTDSSDFPTTQNAFDSDWNGSRDTFIAQFQTGESPRTLTAFIETPRTGEVFLLAPESRVAIHPYIVVKAHCDECKGGNIRALVHFAGIMETEKTFEVTLHYIGRGNYQYKIRLPDHMLQRVDIEAITGEYMVQLLEHVDDGGKRTPLQTGARRSHFTVARDLDNDLIADDPKEVKAFYELYREAYTNPVWKCFFSWLGSTTETRAGLRPIISTLKLIGELSRTTIESAVKAWVQDLEGLDMDVPWECASVFISEVLGMVNGHPFTVAPSDVARRLAERYAPVLYLHPYEAYLPDRVELMIENATLRRQNEKVLLPRHVTAERFSTYNGWDYWLDLGPNLTEIDPRRLTKYMVLGPAHYIPLVIRDAWTQCYQPTRRLVKFYKNLREREQSGPVTYARVIEGSHWVIIQYWLFYMFNDMCNKHEGDWEGVDVVFLGVSSAADVLSSSSIRPAFVAYAQHRSGQRVPWNKVFKDGTHPRVFVALGSHASYPTAGFHAIEDPYVPLNIDWADTDSSPPITPEVVLIEHSEEGEWISENAWATFVGKWGESVGPSSAPRLTANLRWLDPFFWAMFRIRVIEAATQETGLLAWVGSPVELHVYDSAGRHVGPIPGGDIELEIPGATYRTDPGSGHSLIEIPGANRAEEYHVVLRGTDTGIAHLFVAFTDWGENIQRIAEFTEIPVQKASEAQLSVLGKPSRRLQIDMEGDGIFEGSLEADSKGNIHLQPKPRLSGSLTPSPSPKNKLEPEESPGPEPGSSTAASTAQAELSPPSTRVATPAPPGPIGPICGVPVVGSLLLVGLLIGRERQRSR